MSNLLIGFRVAQSKPRLHGNRLCHQGQPARFGGDAGSPSSLPFPSTASAVEKGFFTGKSGGGAVGRALQTQGVKASSVHPGIFRRLESSPFLPRQSSWEAFSIVKHTYQMQQEAGGKGFASRTKQSHVAPASSPSQAPLGLFCLH